MNLLHLNDQALYSRGLTNKWFLQSQRSLRSTKTLPFAYSHRTRAVRPVGCGTNEDRFDGANTTTVLELAVRAKSDASIVIISSQL